MSSVQNGSTFLDEVQDVLGRNMEIGGKVAVLINEISTASDEQSRGIEEINAAMSQIDQLTQTMAANSEESAATSEELSSQAMELNSFIDTLAQMIGGNSSNGNTHVPTLKPDTHNRDIRKKQRALPAKNSLVKQSKKILKPDDIIPLDNEDFEEF